MHFRRDELCDLSGADHVIRADGDIVLVEERMRATLPGGRPYDNDYCFVFIVTGARIREVREYMDTRKGWQMIFEYSGVEPTVPA